MSKLIEFAGPGLTATNVLHRQGEAGATRCGKSIPGVRWEWDEAMMEDAPFMSICTACERSDEAPADTGRDGDGGGQ